MNQFVELLPWRVAALAGLVVGGVSLAVGTDVWPSLERVGEAFAVFGLGGMGLRALLRQGRRAPGGQVDQKTPPMSVGDIAEPPGGARPAAGSRGDETKK